MSGETKRPLAVASKTSLKPGKCQRKNKAESLELGDDPLLQPKVPEDKRDRPQKPAKSAAIDELFAAAKSRKSVKELPKKNGKKPGKVQGSKDDIFDTKQGSARRRTTEGYRIFSEDELRINEGGNTGDCPFDCECCF